MIGKTISHYKIIDKIGGGGMGVVYKAQDLKLERVVALKFLPPDFGADEEERKRFIHEAKAASALQHNNICAIHDIDETEDGQMFICMDYYEGETLKQKMERGPMKVEEATDIAIQLAHGLLKAHEHGIVHRDIKPANVIVTTDGVLKIVDFGLAKLAGRTMLTKEGTTLGTAAYMSPEQARGENVDHRTDIWSLAVVIYQMLTGQLPFKGEYEQSVMYSIINENPEPMTALRRGLPMELERIVSKALAKSPDERYQHLDEMLVDFRRLRKESESSAKIQPLRPIAQKPGKKKPKNLILVGVFLVLSLLGFFVIKPLFEDELFASKPVPVAVISFVNQTGDKSYDYLQDAIPNLLITNLEQSRYLRVTTWERLYDLLKQVGKSDVRVIDRDLGFELCTREGIEAIVLGTFTRAGDIFATDVKVLNVRTKEIMKSANSKGEGVGSILKNQIDELSKEISRGVGLSQRRIESAPAQVAEYTTSSMDAYNYFLRGKADYHKFYYEDARKFLEKALQIDSTFASAYLYLGATCSDLSDDGAMKSAFQKARLYAGKAPEKERLNIDMIVALKLERNDENFLRLTKELLDKYPKEKFTYFVRGIYFQTRKMFGPAIENLEKAIELDPNYAEAVNQLAYIFAQLGDLEKAIESLKKYAAMIPGDANPFDSMGEIYFRMGKLDDAISKYKEALEVKPDFYSSLLCMGYVCCFKEEYAEGEKWFARAIETMPSGGLKSEGYFDLGDSRFGTGRYEKLMGDLQQSFELAAAQGNGLLKYLCDGARGWVHYERGELEASKSAFRRSFEFAVGKDSSLTPRYLAELNLNLGLVDLKEGKIEAARSKLREIENEVSKVDPVSRDVIMFNHDLLHAELLLAQDSLDKAIAVCEGSVLMGMPTFGSENMFRYNYPFIRDTKARVYIRKGDIDKAIAEYERIVTIVRDSKDRRLIHPKDHYRLATLYEKKGLKEKAISQYRRFLEIWKDADRDLPEPIDVRKRLQILTRGS